MMRMISSNGRQFNLSGLPALILGGVIAAVAGVLLMTVTVFGAIFLTIRVVLKGLLGFFGAAETSPKIPMTNTHPDNPNTIEMRRDHGGSWRRE